MNPLIVLGFVALGAALVAAVTAPLVWATVIAVSHEQGDPFPVGRLAAAIAAFIVALTATIWIVGTIIPTTNGSEHCGPGTHYLETGSGKNRSWVCVAS